jgi:hypothetical protein
LNEKSERLGFYAFFPEKVHKTVHFVTSISNRRLQQAFVRVLNKLNQQSFNMEEILDPSEGHSLVVFEFGVAEGNNFTFLDDEEANRMLRVIRRSPFQSIDLLCAIGYYKICGEKKTPLRFDYYMLRLGFDQKSVEIQAFHERGAMHLSPEDVAEFLADKINEGFSRKALRILGVF